MAAGRFVAFLLTAVRAVAWILAGLLLLIVPGIVLALRYSLAHLAVLLEPCSGACALARSQELVSAEPKRAIGFMAAATAAALTLNLVVAVLVAALMGVAQALGAGPVGAVAGQLQALLSELLGGLLGAWLIGFTVLLYRDLAGRHPCAAA